MSVVFWLALRCNRRLSCNDTFSLSP
ncbi:hypothetical protein YPPY101_2811, partial [Yersinia pestis PY-101]